MKVVSKFHVSIFYTFREIYGSIRICSFTLFFTWILGYVILDKNNNNVQKVEHSLLIHILLTFVQELKMDRKILSKIFRL